MTKYLLSILYIDLTKERLPRIGAKIKDGSPAAQTV